MTQYRKYDDLRIGQIFPEEPAIFHVDELSINSYRAIARDAAGKRSVAEAGTAPPMLAAVYIRSAQNALKGPPGGVHAKQSFRFHEPVSAGDILSTVLEVIEKYDRKGRRYLVCETRTTNARGVLVTTGRMVSIWGNEDV